MSFNDLVSIIIPYYNHKNFITELLESIKNQDYKKIETILIDDGSTDGSQQLLKKLKKQYLFKLKIKSNEGVVKTINHGLKLASGNFIIIIASDDVMPLNRVSQQLELIHSADFDVIGGGITLISKESKKLEYVKPRIIGDINFDQSLFYNPCYAPTLMIKADVFKKYGFYNSEWIIEDYPFLLKLLSKKLKIANFNKNWAYYRIQDENFIHRAKWYFDGAVQSLNEYKGQHLVQKAINYHDFIFRLKRSLFYGLSELSGSRKVLDYDESKIICYVKYVTLLLLALQPKLLRRFLMTLIQNKSNLLLKIAQLFALKK